MSSRLADWLHGVRQGVADATPRAAAFAQHVLVLPTTRSTNDDVARAAIEGAPEGYTVIAAEQTAGRGRRGAAWHSPAADGLYLSTLLRPDRWGAVRDDIASPAPGLITLMAGVAVVRAIGEVCDAPVELKWPNDVMVRSSSRRGPRPPHGVAVPSVPDDDPPWRKLAGILAEGASDGGVLRTVVLGIGLNLRASRAPDDVARRMVSLADLCGEAQAPPVGAIVAALLVQLRDGCLQLARGACTTVRDEWCALAPSVDDAIVRWHHQGVTRRGRSLGIDPAGALRVCTDDGQHVTVHGGDVEWLLDES